MRKTPEHATIFAGHREGAFGRPLRAVSRIAGDLRSAVSAGSANIFTPRQPVEAALSHLFSQPLQEFLAADRAAFQQAGDHRQIRQRRVHQQDFVQRELLQRQLHVWVGRARNFFEGPWRGRIEKRSVNPRYQPLKEAVEFGLGNHGPITAECGGRNQLLFGSVIPTLSRTVVAGFGACQDVAHGIRFAGGFGAGQFGVAAAGIRCPGSCGSSSDTHHADEPDALPTPFYNRTEKPSIIRLNPPEDRQGAFDAERRNCLSPCPAAKWRAA